jgi:hypothetical protein
MLLITEENGLEVFKYAVGVILHLVSASYIAYPYIPPRPPFRLIHYQNKYLQAGGYT